MNIFVMPLYVFLMVLSYFPIFILCYLISHGLVFYLLSRYLKISMEFITIFFTTLKSSISGFFFDFLSILIMLKLSDIIIETLNIRKNVTFQISTNLVRSLPGYALVLFAVLVTRLCYYYINKKVVLAGLELDEVNLNRLNLYMTFFTTPFILFIPFDLIFK